ncbi:ankyrin repeat domain-containing protein [Gracilimonas halophila]|uniref:Ankyrin repeat domain-containing protein n=1 Tax=Gracilimonas halophila TaxID=1834464 RepID=A0ABW5JHW2_9BACT
MLAAKGGNTDVVKYLIENGANVKLRDKNGDTAMMIAMDNDQDDIALILRRAGAKAEVKPKKDTASVAEDEDEDDIGDTPDVDDLVDEDEAPDDVDLDE